MTEAPASTTDDPAVVKRLAPDCTASDLEEGSLYHATVDGVVRYGAFVQLAPDLSGLVHESTHDGERSFEEGDEVVVELLEVKENGDLSFAPADAAEFETVEVEHAYEVTPLADVVDREGEAVHVEAVVGQVKQTGGPTLFHLADGTGVVPAASFEAAGVRAHPEIGLGDVVHVAGHVDRRDDGVQIEADRVEAIEDEESAADVRSTIGSRLEERSAANEVEPLIEWPALAEHVPELERVAALLRRAVLEHRPIVIRHHADTDGICAAVPVERALERFVEETHTADGASDFMLKRRPSRAPFYDVEDVTRDLSFALEDRARHGQQLPLLVMIDNGSTEEDVPAYRHLDAYGVPVVVIDHHHPDVEAVEPYVTEHVNPYRHGDDYRITTGMLCAELARMIDPEVTESIKHVPAVAGLADRSSADEMADYLALAAARGYNRDDCNAIGDALDYAAYWLRYNGGRGVIDDVLGVTENRARHEDLVQLLSTLAARDIRRQLDAALPHVETETLDNGVRLNTVDVDEYAYRFTYPAPGTTTGAIHDRVVTDHGGPVITVGYGPDFAVLRSDGVRLDIPQMVDDLNEAFAGAGVSGGGHLVVGSIKFVPGMREEVLSALFDEMAAAEIDESLGAAAPRTYDVD